MSTTENKKHFGPEWEAEMMGLEKAELINLLKQSQSFALDVEHPFCRIILLPKEKAQILLIVHEDNEGEQPFWYIQLQADFINLRGSAQFGNYQTQEEAVNDMLEYSEKKACDMYSGMKQLFHKQS